MKLIVSTSGKAHTRYHASSSEPLIDVPTVGAIDYGRVTGSVDREGDFAYAYLTLDIEQAQALRAKLDALILGAQVASAGGA